MSYIGQTPTGLYTTTNAKDTFSGDASATSFTLSQAGTTNNVDVFVENVRQEPTVAYVVDGNTLTFTAPPVSGTDNIYVVNRGPAELSASHPASQALEAYSGTFTTDLTVNGAFTSQGIDDNASSTAMTIDSSGNLLIGEDSGDSFNSDSMLRIQRTGGRVFQQFKCDADQNVQILFGDVDDDVECAIQYHPSDKDLRFTTGNNNEAMRILSTGGITFNGDTSTANALDDYEEGTWTPVYSSTFTQGCFDTGTGFSTAVGRYTKIGQLVWCYAEVTVSGATSNITIGANYSVNYSSLPFTPVSSGASFNVLHGTAMIYGTVGSALIGTASITPLDTQSVFVITYTGVSGGFAGTAPQSIAFCYHTAS
jgi:hypothetical protein